MNSDSADQIKKSADTQAMLFGINQLIVQIEAERVALIKEKLEKNGKKLQSHISQVVLATVTKNVEDYNVGEKLSSRIKNPLFKFPGVAQGTGEKDYINSQEVIFSMSTKLPKIENVPPYTTWIFLDRNQRMAEDQSVVGRRRIYYDQYGSEALICSDSEEEIPEPEEEKHEFCESEDRILWVTFQEHGSSEEVANFVSQFIGGSTLEIQERYNILQAKYIEKRDHKGLEETKNEKNIILEKSLSAALDSFDNIFCRRCLVFDCRLHGCSQNLINPSEKQSFISRVEENEKPCSDHCYLRPRAHKKRLEGSIINASTIIGSTNLEEKNMNLLSSDLERRDQNQDLKVNNEVLNLDTSTEATNHQESFGKHNVLKRVNTELEESSSYLEENSHKKQKQLLPSDIENTAKNLDSVSCDDIGDSCDGRSAYSIEQKIRHISDAKWKPIEKDLYLKGVEIFGKNSCLVARNLLSGLKTCIEVASYMYDGGAPVPRRSSFVSRSFMNSDEKDDSETMDQEMPTRSRFFRRRGRTKKLKYSSKSAGNSSVWKRIVDGKNQSCQQYTPCGCESMCGKQCPCANNGTCCEKYCGCSKSCKNRFRGCHCAKSQCRSRQCPCFAAGRECDPDVCRNCWVSCGDDSVAEPRRKGDGQCGNMRLLLHQQQKILLGKSDVAGWGAFIKNSVNKNEYLGEYTGELISHREADKRGKIYDRANSSFLFDLNDQYVLDAYRKGDKLKFANHSSNPNCYAKVMLVAGDHRVGIFAKEHIEASEELFYDYRYGPDQAPIWARKPEGSKRDESTTSYGRAKKHQSH